MTDEWIRSGPSEGFWSRHPPGVTLSDEDIYGMALSNQLNNQCPYGWTFISKPLRGAKTWGL
mgnify:FL=1